MDAVIWMRALTGPLDGTGDMVVRTTLSLSACEIRLSRPNRANALNPTLVETLMRAVTRAYSDGTRLLVLRGEGRNFCAGFDQSDAATIDHLEISARTMQIEALLQLLWQAPFVTVARVQRAAFGAGADLVAACDYRLGTDGVRMAFPGFRKFGVTLGTRRLATLIGSDRAFDLVLRGRTVDAEEAISMRLLTHRLNDEGATAFIRQLASEIEELGTRSFAALREATRGEGAAAGDLSRVVRSIGEVNSP
ncbi:MAG: enoyl-CoA hydratase/isomerase family protein [Hyphomicrobium sp.]|nr:enoyl-CoA hydratase/isomerase family protein [Hyphomicrobium sp.]